MLLSPAQSALKAWCLEHEGCPYVYDAKGEIHATPSGGQVTCFDCSGFVTSAIHAAGGPDWRKTHGSTGLVTELGPLLELAPQPFAIAVYGHPIDHVMLAMDDGRVLGASGAGSQCTSVELALRAHACVHFKSAVSYRNDFRGYLPLPAPLR